MEGEFSESYYYNLLPVGGSRSAPILWQWDLCSSGSQINGTLLWNAVCDKTLQLMIDHKIDYIIDSLINLQSISCNRLTDRVIN